MQQTSSEAGPLPVKHAHKVPPRAHPLARSERVDRLCRFFEKAWAKGWLPPPVLDHEELWAIAVKGRDPLDEGGGRSGEDVADFRLRLERLTKAARQEANLNELGRVMAHGQLVRVIKQRLALGRYWRANPHVLQTDLAPPIIIIGQMRSGTTRLHKLFASDPAHAHTRYCDAFHPVSGRLVDLREWKASFEIRLLSALNPWLQSIHPIQSTAVEEELGWLAGALNHAIYDTQWHIPSYARFSEERDAGPIYREFARLLRTDAAHRGNAMLPRVMKVPVFSENLPELLAQFPDARLVIAKRDDEAVLKSAVSLAANQMAVQSNTCDLDAIRTELVGKMALRNERSKAALADWSGPIAELSFGAMNEDWEREIKRTYRELGLDLSADALSAMRAMMAQSRGAAHTAHASQLDGFSVPAAQ